MIEQAEADTPAKNSGDMIMLMINMIPPMDQPKGTENFFKMYRIMEAITLGKRHKEIILEDDDWNFLKNHAFKHIPARWAMRDDLYPIVKLITTPEYYNAAKPDQKIQKEYRSTKKSKKK